MIVKETRGLEMTKKQIKLMTTAERMAVRLIRALFLILIIIKWLP